MSEKNYLKVDVSSIDVPTLPARYIVFSVAFTSDTRRFEHIKGVVMWALEGGYVPVFLGQRSGESKVGDSDLLRVGVDLIGKTTLLQATRIMGEAAAVVCMDGGLMHLAGCTDVPIVAGFTTVDPLVRMPIRHNKLGWRVHPVVPDATLECRYCQCYTNFLFDHDYRTCIYDDFACVKQLTTERFIAPLKGILNG